MDKFPSIPHLSFSPQINDDDVIIQDTKLFVGGDGEYKLCIHEKLDGGNCCIFRGNVYARTHKHPTKHPWFNTIKDLIRSQPLFYEEEYSNLMIFGENMTAIHSISYNNLTSYFYIFAVYNPSQNIWFSVKKVQDIANKLNIPTAPLLFEGNFNSLKEIKDWMDKEIKKPSMLGSNDREGFVMRINASFPMNKFYKSMAKYVRKGHIQTDKNWTRTWKKAQISYNNDNNNDNDKEEEKKMDQQKINKNKKKKQRKQKKKKQIKPTLKTSLIICCGLPGSGKSTFAKHLSQHRNEWERAGTDLFNKNKNAVFEFVAKISKDNQKKCIVENCNVSVAKRQELLNCAFKPNDAICIYFDIDKKECIQRTKNRSNHETKHLFKSSKGNKIIDSFWKQFQIPTIKEGFKQIITVKNDDDINGLLSRLGVKQSIQTSYDDKNDDNDKNENDDINDNEDEEERKVAIKNIKRRRKIKEKRDDNLYYAIMAKSRFAMSVKMLCKKLKLDINNILNVYVIGSRIWGTAQSKSDWDVMIITNNKNERVFESIDNIDAYILDKYQWKRELNNHRFILWLTLFLPIDGIWKQDLKICHVNKNQLNLDKNLNDVKVNGFGFKLFIDALSREIDKDCKKLNKFFIKNKLDKVYKTFIHSLRMINICKKMVILLQENYEIKDENESNIDIQCESFGDKSFVGMIKFDEIENMVREKQKQLEIISISSNKQQTVDIWVNELKNGLKQCQNLIA